MLPSFTSITNTTPRSARLLNINPAINGKTVWDLSYDGALLVTSGISSSFQVLSSSANVTAKVELGSAGGPGTTGNTPTGGGKIYGTARDTTFVDSFTSTTVLTVTAGQSGTPPSLSAPGVGGAGGVATGGNTNTSGSPGLASTGAPGGAGGLGAGGFSSNGSDGGIGTNSTPFGGSGGGGGGEAILNAYVFVSTHNYTFTLSAGIAPAGPAVVRIT